MLSGDFPCGFPATSLSASLGVPVADTYVFDIKEVIGAAPIVLSPKKNFFP
jgi:hypothetical protein